MARLHPLGSGLQAFATKRDSIFHQVEETSNKINDILLSSIATNSKRPGSVLDTGIFLKYNQRREIDYGYRVLLVVRELSRQRY